MLSWRQTLLVYAFWSADLAFYLINLTASSASCWAFLAIGFIFDRFGPRSDAEQTRKLFTHTLRMLARLGFSSIQRDTDNAFPEIQRLLLSEAIRVA